MIKELTPLEALNNIKLKLMRSYDNSCGCNGNAMFEKELPIIETALKEKENIEKTINELFSENGKVITTIEIKKKLKVLEIIKEYFVLTSYYGKVSLEPRKPIPDNKYEELREVLL